MMATMLVCCLERNYGKYKTPMVVKLYHFSLYSVQCKQRKFKLVKRRAVYYQNVIPPSLLNCECSLRTPTDSMMYQGGPWNEKKQA